MWNQKKLKKLKQSKVNKHLLRLNSFKNKAHMYLDMLWVGSIVGLILIIFGILFLFSVTFITSNQSINTTNLWNPYVNNNQSVNDPQATKNYFFDFGIYWYEFKLTPVQGTNITALLAHGLPPQFLKTYVGPYLTSYGIAFVSLECILVVYCISSISVFVHYNKILKFHQDGKNVLRFFKWTYALILVFVILICSMVEINFIPSASLLDWLYNHFVVNHSNNKTSSTVSNNSMKIIMKYLNKFESTGLYIPVSLFSKMFLQYNMVNNVINVHFSYAWWVWIVFGFGLIFSICDVISISFLIKNNKKYEFIINNLISEEKDKKQDLNIKDYINVNNVQ